MLYDAFIKNFLKALRLMVDVLLGRTEEATAGRSELFPFQPYWCRHRFFLCHSSVQGPSCQTGPSLVIWSASRTDILMDRFPWASVRANIT